MHRRPGKRSPQVLRRLPWCWRQVVGVVLLVGCLPALLLNVGTGLGLWIHDHGDGSLHTHVVAAPRQPGHAHPHVRGHQHVSDDAEPSGVKATSPQPHPLEHRGDGTVIRGTEVVLSKKQESARDLSALSPSPVAPLPSAAAPKGFAPFATASQDRGGGLRDTRLACLRAVILLI